MIGAGLLGCAELVVCDQCWQLAGGTAAVRAKLTDNGGQCERLEPLLVFAPAVEALLAGADEYDQLHPVDRLLVESGVRWVVLRHVAVPARMDLARWVLERAAPPATRPADSPRAWLAAVEARIREQTGTEFTYNPKRRRWWRICNVLRHCADRDRRPLTWVTQEEIAAAVGCSTRTVRRCIAWLRGEGLLFEVVPGCRLPQQAAPDGESSGERAARHQALAEAIATEEAAIARARAELDAVRAGHRGTQALDTAQDPLSPQLAAPTSPDELDADERPLVRLAPVYELRLPRDPADHTAPRRPAVVTVDGLASENADDPEQIDQNDRPPQVYHQDQTKSSPVHPVDKRRAPRDPDHRTVTRSETGTGSAAVAQAGPVNGDQPRARQSEAVRAAQWLLRSRLDPRICDDVSIRWLAAQIRSSHLLDQHHWTFEDLADQLHGYPQYTHLPRYIRNPRAWIRARITRATPTLSPTKLRIIQQIERASPTFQQRRQAAAEQARRAEITRRRTAIDACELCDELGWLHMPADTPTTRCTHDRSTSGW